MDRLIAMAPALRDSLVSASVLSAAVAGAKAHDGERHDDGYSRAPCRISSGFARGERPMDDAGGRLWQHSAISPLSRSTPATCRICMSSATMATGIPHGHEGGPLVVGSTLYMVTPFPNNLIASI